MDPKGGRVRYQLYRCSCTLLNDKLDFLCTVFNFPFDFLQGPETLRDSNVKAYLLSTTMQNYPLNLGKELRAIVC